MTLLRAFHAEMLKMKRTIALKMVVLSPAIVVLVVLFVGSQSPFTVLHLHSNNEWTELARANLRFWAMLMLPLYITLECALIAGLDHSENQWKSLLARPLPRWTLYVAKLTIILAMTAIAMLVLLFGILMDGTILPGLQKEAAFQLPVPWGGDFSRRRTSLWFDVSGSHDSALGKLALEFIFRRGRHWYRRQRNRLLRRGSAENR
jgi:hypothetical protein